jgi:hypothetical protein
MGSHRVYLDYVLIWPEDCCITAETCCLAVNCRIFNLIIDIIYVVFKHDNNITTTYYNTMGWLAYKMTSYCLDSSRIESR